MSKIIYGVAGEGSGHSTRSKEIINYLINSGHKVKVVSYDKGYKNLSPFFDVEEIEGLGFDFKNNQVKYISTFVKNGKKIKEILSSYDKVNNLVKKFRPDIIFTDFEPTCAVASQINKIPLVSIDNQHFITNTKIKYPKKFIKEAFLTSAFVKLIANNSKYFLVLSITEEKVVGKKTFLVPPILRKEVLELKPVSEDYILVYLTSGFDEIVSYLNKIDKKFIVYGLERYGKINNCIFKKPSQDMFLADLGKCQGVIATAGFSLLSEALYLGKPYLAIPVQSQFEQIINAYYLEKMGYGMFCEKITTNAIKKYLDKIPEYIKNLKMYKKEDNSKIFSLIDNIMKKYGNFNR